MKKPETAPADWDLGDWEAALTINVGALYACNQCGNLVVVTRGGVGTLELACCGTPMEKVCPGSAASESPTR
jgi:desulfoferrodoxin-like iron-binding protein